MPRRQKTSNATRPAWAERIRMVRGERSQKDFARLCNVSQVAVSRWELGDDQPTPRAFARLAALCSGADRAYFWNLSGFQTLHATGPDWYSDSRGISITPASFEVQRLPEVETVRNIPLLRNALVAGTPRESDANSISEYLMLPAHWFREGGQLCAFEVQSETMHTMIPPGSISIIDTSLTDPTALEDRIVAIRDWQWLHLGWLQRHGHKYVFVPETVSSVTPVYDIQPTGDYSIAGPVVRWIGPPSR